MSKKRKLAHMAAKKQKTSGHSAGPPKHGGPNKSSSKSSSSKKTNHDRPKQPSSAAAAASLAPTIPFDPSQDNILLVGEGDLSFAASLVEHHSCLSLTATVLEDSRDALLAKYPHAADKIALLEDAGARVLYGVDAKTMGPWSRKVAKRAVETKAEAEDENEDNDKDKDAENDRPAKAASKNKTDRKGTTLFDRILFNFPHVGGKSTDVNRQVRYNQELLVAFFQRALLSLAPRGSIVVTLFEGEPYTLWNIRDLARHAGLQVERSFRFQFAAYPGYHHARTLGVVRKKSASGGASGGASTPAEESKSAWKGEDRASRSYVFVRKDDAPAKPAASQKTKGNKRGRDDSSSDDDDDGNDGKHTDDDSDSDD